MSIKKQCLEKADYQCANCNNNAKHAHHIVPLSIGGSNILTNLVALCEECHSLIHDLNFTKHSFLTKKGLERARARGVELGGLRRRTEASNKARRLQAMEKAHELQIVADLRASGLSFGAIAASLNNAGVPSPSGRGKWHAGAAKRIVDRLSV